MSRKDRSRSAARGAPRGGRGERPAARRLLPPALGSALAVIAAAGAAVSVYLTQVRKLVLLGAEAGALCAIDDWLDCRTVLASPYATIGGVPLSVFATWFYVVTGVLALLGLRENMFRLPRSPATVLFVAYASATGLSVGLAVLSATSLASLCPLCASLYALNTIGLVLAVRAIHATDETVREALERERSYWSARPGAVLRFAAATLVALPLVLAASRVSAPDGELCELIATAPKENRLHLAIFSDFQCQHCQELHRALRGVRDNQDVLLELRHFPLEAECNPRVSRTRSRGACLKARAALCADPEGRRVELIERLFAGDPADVVGITALAESLGMNAHRYASCLESPETAAALNRDVRAAIENGVHGTPTLFLNGRRLAGVPKAEGIACLRAYRRVRNAEASAR